MRFRPARLLIAEDALDLQYTRALLSRLRPVSLEVVPDSFQPSPGCPGGSSATGPLWVIKKHKGRFLRLCPGTPRHRCCLYQVINLVLGCPMDCSYCILQAYLGRAYITLYANIEDAVAEISGKIASTGERIFRFGTGELSDSLALDPLLGLAERLILLFSEARGGLLELKTKSDHIDHLLGIEHKCRTVISWSLNTAGVISSEEHSTAPLEKRLEAARRCQEAGYPIGIHFDPIIWYPNWERDYGLLVEETFEYLDAGRIIWISLGALRFPPSLKELIRIRCPESQIPSAELVPGLDGKLRYLKPVRIRLFSKLVELLRKIRKDLFIYLCMETREVWEEVLGWSPDSKAHLEAAFADHSRRYLSERSRLSCRNRSTLEAIRSPAPPRG